MADRLDGIDVSQVIETMRSDGHALIVARMQAIHASKIKELRNPDMDHGATQALRGFLDGIDRCLAVPQQLRDEFDERRK